MLGDQSLSRIVDFLGNVYFRLGLLLGLTKPVIEQFEVKFPNNLWRLNFEVLTRWRDDNRHQPNMVDVLIKALRNLDLNDVVDVVRDGECINWFKFIIVNFNHHIMFGLSFRLLIKRSIQYFTSFLI